MSARTLPAPTPPRRPAKPSRAPARPGSRACAGNRAALAGRAGAIALVLGQMLLSAPPARSALPAEGTCPPVGLTDPDRVQVDAIAVPLKEGLVLEHSDLLALQLLLPPEIWSHRRVFFHEGMKMEIGPCHRRYPVPAIYEQATRAPAGEARLDDANNLRGYRAGTPFPPESIDPQDPKAGARWAWNLEYRYRGAGPIGEFRLTDFPSRLGGVQTYRGDFFQLQTKHRADLGESDYQTPGVDEPIWVAGGRFDEPFDARHLAWRQIRPEKADRNWKTPDRTYVYVPAMRKPRRAATTWVDGLFMPRYRVSSPEGGGGVPFGGDQYGVQGAIAPTSAVSSTPSEHIRRGLVGQSLRPNAYRWRYLGEREVLAPLNGSREGYPTDPDRNFGESGLSVGSDRWELRYAVVIEGLALQQSTEIGSVTLYIDYQTQQPLYYISRRRNRLVLDVGVFVHRFSGDLPEYPEWPGGGKAFVFDPVASVFFSAAEGGTGWRRESYDVRSVPVSETELRAMASTASLTRGR